MVPLTEDAGEEAVEFQGSVVFKPSLTVFLAIRRPPKDLLPPECSLRASEVGTDLRAVRVNRRGAFGEIALPRRCMGEVGFVAAIWDAAR